MSDKAEAAQKWAEAKSALDAADASYEAAKEAYAKAEDAEYHAWQALEALAGRVSPPVAETQTIAHVRPDARAPFRHSLAQKPVG